MLRSADRKTVAHGGRNRGKRNSKRQCRSTGERLARPRRALGDAKRDGRAFGSGLGASGHPDGVSLLGNLNADGSSEETASLRLHETRNNDAEGAPCERMLADNVVQRWSSRRRLKVQTEQAAIESARW